MRRRPHLVRAQLAPTRTPGLTDPPGPWAGLLDGRIHLPRRFIRFAVRRLLVVGALVICGWLISSGQSAHAADDPSPSASSLRNAVGTAKAATAKAATAAAAAHTGTAHLTKTHADTAHAGPTSATAPARAVPADTGQADAARGLATRRNTGNTGTRAVTDTVTAAGAALTSAHSGDAAPAQSSSAQSSSARSSPAQSSPARSSRPSARGTSLGAAADGTVRGIVTGAGRAVRQTPGMTGGIGTSSLDATGAIGTASTGDAGPSLALGPVPLLAPVPGLEPLSGLAGFADLPSTVLPSTVTEAVDSLTGVVRQQAGAMGAVTALVTGPAGALGQLNGLTARLVPRVTSLLSQVTGLVTPAVPLLGPLDDVVAITGAGHVAAPIESLIPPARAITSGGGYQSAAGPPRAGPSPMPDASPAGSGHVGAGSSDPLPVANLPATPADRPPGAIAPSSAEPVLCGQWPAPLRGPVVKYAHMSGRGHGPLSPGDTNLPLSGGSTKTLPTPSQTDGTGDSPPSWEARVTETFVPLWIVAPPAVRTAADEPALSPD